jgi:hypothetical protein
MSLDPSPPQPKNYPYSDEDYVDKYFYGVPRTGPANQSSTLHRDRSPPTSTFRTSRPRTHHRPYTMTPSSPNPKTPFFTILLTLTPNSACPASSSLEALTRFCVDFSTTTLHQNGEPEKFRIINLYAHYHAWKPASEVSIGSLHPHVLNAPDWFKREE